MNYKLAFALGTIPPGVVGREPVAYLYNGVRLPKLPETELPYAVIYKDANFYGLYFSDMPAYSTVGFGADTFYMNSLATRSAYTATLESDAWEFYKNYAPQESTGTVMGTGAVVWSNHDIKRNGSDVVSFNGTNPVPIYE